MKNIPIVLFLFFLNASSYAQEPKDILVDFIWNLNELTIDDTVVDWSFNDEMGTVGATFDYDGTSQYYVSAGACNGIYAELTNVDNMAFTAVDFSITANECNLPETIAFETAYFDEFFKRNDPNHTFTYVIDLANPEFPNLTVTNEDGDIALFNGESMLGLNQTTLAGISIFPNPADDFLTVSSKNTTILQVSVYNLQGQKVMSIPFRQSQNKILISGLEAGIYFLKAEGDKGQKHTTKFVKE